MPWLAGSRLLRKLCVFRFRLFQDRSFRVGASPDGEEILVSSLCFRAIAGGGIRTPQTKMRESTDRLISNHADMAENLLKFSCRSGTVAGGQIALGLPS
jgi:hypothetical protein